MFWTLVSSILLSFLKGIEQTTSLAAASEQPDQTKEKRKISSNEKRKSPSGELKDDQGTPRKSSKTWAVERAMASFMEYQHQADEMYLNQIREQREIEAQFPREEIKAHKDSSEVFARLLSEIYLRRENNSVHPPQGSVSHFQDLSYFEP